MKRLSERKLAAFSDDQAVNPMDSVSNLADAMLVLAVGIMLALIINWNVDISINKTETSVDTLELKQEDVTEAPEGSEAQLGGNLEEMGTVYFDAKTGNYYIVQNK